jgi:hypothetical protein
MRGELINVRIPLRKQALKGYRDKGSKQFL